MTSKAKAMDVVSSPAGGGIGISSASASSVSGSGGRRRNRLCGFVEKGRKGRWYISSERRSWGGVNSTVGGAGQKAAPSHRAVMTERLKQLWGGQLAEMEAPGC